MSLVGLTQIFTPSEYLSLTENMSLTECTECTEFFRQRLKDRWLTLRVPSGFELSPTDYTDFYDLRSIGNKFAFRGN